MEPVASFRTRKSGGRAHITAKDNRSVTIRCMKHSKSAGDSRSRGRELLDSATSVAGDVAGATAGLFLGGPEGALLGAAIGAPTAAALSWGIQEVGSRSLGRRGQERAMGAAAYAADRLRDLKKAGLPIRNDGFFENPPSGRNVGREVAEGVLMAAHDAFEERKVRHIGYLYANVATDPKVDAALAAASLASARELTWRQYVLLAALGRENSSGLLGGQLEDDPGSWSGWGARQELNDLLERNYVMGGTDHTERFSLPLPSSDMTRLKLARRGVLMCHLLSLDTISNDEVDETKNMLVMNS